MLFRAKFEFSAALPPLLGRIVDEGEPGGRGGGEPQQIKSCLFFAHKGQNTHPSAGALPSPTAPLVLDLGQSSLTSEGSP